MSLFVASQIYSPSQGVHGFTKIGQSDQALREKSLTQEKSNKSDRDCETVRTSVADMSTYVLLSLNA